MSAESTPIPNTLSQIQRNSAHSDLQAIHADYYNITNANGAPLAGLLVLLDRKNRPVRAELHLSESSVGAQQELAQRQAYLLLGNRYTGERPLPLNVLRTELEQERLSVPLDPSPPPSAIPAWVRPLILGIGAMLLFAALGWMLNDWLQARFGSDTSDPTLLQAEPTATTAATVIDFPVAVDPADTDNSNGDRIFQTNDLPVSRNALPMEVGQRVRIRPGFNAALRTEAGAGAGQEIGYVEGGAEMTIVNGPIWLEGNSDTIVWWFVRLDDNTQAWVAANTSDWTLLEPVP